ncbi:MAG TPA: NUDIX domain-containing protein [Candidatus Saccharimonadales bacterium]
MSETLNLPSLAITEAQLARVRAHVAEGPNDAYYPAPEDCLHADTPGVEIDHEARRLVIPYEVSGRPAPWHVQHHPNRTEARENPKLAPLLDPEIVSTQHTPLPFAVARHYLQQGYWLDQYGNPVPYAAVQMLEDPEIGVITGLGAAWHKGINQSSDLVLAVKPSLHDAWRFAVVVRKNATNHDGMTAFPGGHNDKDEAGALAAQRETSEETGLPQALLGDPDGYERLNASLLIGAGATAHAMSGNEVFLHIVQGAAAKKLLDTPLKASNESYGVGWRTTAELAKARAIGKFFPHHLGHLALAEARLINIR